MITVTGAVGRVEEISERERNRGLVISSGAAGGALADPARNMEKIVAGRRALRAWPGFTPDAEELGFCIANRRSTFLLMRAVTGSGGTASAGFREEEPKRRGLASHDALC